jgi:hypothetical protein
MNFETNYQHWGWNLSLLATILTLLIFRFRDPNKWKQKLGIDFKLFDWLGFLVLLISLLFLSYFLVDYISDVNGYSFKPELIQYKDYYVANYPFFLVLGDYLYFIPQTFNEEIFVGSFLLFGLERNCKTRTSLRSGTVMHASNIPFRYWFIAMHLLTSTKKSFSTLEIQRQIGHKFYGPIWFMVNKIRKVMGERDSQCQLDDVVELDEGFFTSVDAKRKNN